MLIRYFNPESCSVFFSPAAALFTGVVCITNFLGARAIVVLQQMAMALCHLPSLVVE